MTLVPIVIIVGLIGAFVVRGQFNDVLLTVGFGIFGFFMVRFDVSRVALIIALVLGPLAEENFHRAFQISRGDVAILYDRPLSLLLIAGIVLVLALPFWQNYRASGD
jgi:putative tricarboxylic transport membrane protein